MNAPEPPPRITVHYPMGEELTKRYHAAVSDRLDELMGGPERVTEEMLRLQTLVNDMLARREAL